MGFEHRQSVRVKADFHVFYWQGIDGLGSAQGGQAVNLSVSGMAFTAGRELARGQELVLELSPSGQGGPLKLRAQVQRCETAGPGTWLLRVQFTAMDGDSHIRLRQHVLGASDPKLAAATGWGKAYFLDQRHFEAEYRELPAGLMQKWLDEREYLAAKGLVYLKQFQAYLEAYLGARIPGAFKLLGSRPLKPKRVAWMELKLPEGQLHLLAGSLWCEHETGQKAIVGLQPLAYLKEEALRIEKGDLIVPQVPQPEGA